MKRIAVIFVVWIIVGVPSVMSTEKSNRNCDEEASALGSKVLAVQQAIADPTAPDAMNQIKALGLDSRYYVMVRGWLSMQLTGDRSIASAIGDTTPQHIRQRIDFLERAIRSIDLE